MGWSNNSNRVMGMAKLSMGRPRKVTRRFPNGQPYRAPDRVSAETVFVRQRDLRKDGIDPEQWQNSLAGFSLGRLRLRGLANKDDPGGISEEQFRAGEAWARVIHRHSQIMGYEVRRNVKSPAFVMVGGMSCAPEATDDEIGSVRTKFRLCYDSLMEASKVHSMRVAMVTWDVCIDNCDIGVLSKDDHGKLRIGLNALDRVLG